MHRENLLLKTSDNLFFLLKTVGDTRHLTKTILKYHLLSKKRFGQLREVRNFLGNSMHKKTLDYGFGKHQKEEHMM